MKMSEQILLLPLITKLWAVVGYNFYKTTWRMNILTTIAFFLMFGIPALGFMVLIKEEINTNTLADTFESCGPYYQLLCKIVINRFALGKIRSLLQQMEKDFWPIDKFGIEIKEKQIKIYKFMKICLKSYMYAIYLCGTTVSIRPLFLETRRYPLIIYNFIDINNTAFYVTIYTWEVFNFIYGISYLVAVSALFACFVTNVLCQIIMLREAFATLRIDQIQTDEEEENCYGKVKEYVDHHNVILNFIQQLGDLYSIQLFNQFMGNTASICMGIYIASAAGVEDISTVLRAFTIILSFFLELVVYCAGGTLLTEACLQLSDSMYCSGWEGPYRKRLRYANQMVIMRAQKPQKLRAAKLFDVNLNGLTNIVRTAISVYTLMNSVNEK